MDVSARIAWDRLGFLIEREIASSAGDDVGQMAMDRREMAFHDVAGR